MRGSDDITYEMLEQRLSRSGAKTTTLDFKNEPLYREHADAFLQRRGIDLLRDIGPAISAVVEKQASRIAEQREALADLWSRAEHALQRIGLGRTPDDTGIAAKVAPIVTQPMPVPAPHELVGPVRPQLVETVQVQSDQITEGARQRYLNSTQAKEHQAEMSARLERIYRNPKAAHEAITSAVLRMSGDTARLSEQIRQRPESFGQLRGATHLIDGRAQRAEREEAMRMLPEVATLARVQMISWRNGQERHEAAEGRR